MSLPVQLEYVKGLAHDIGVPAEVDLDALCIGSFDLSLRDGLEQAVASVSVLGLTTFWLRQSTGMRITDWTPAHVQAATLFVRFSCANPGLYMKCTRHVLTHPDWVGAVACIGDAFSVADSPRLVYCYAALRLCIVGDNTPSSIPDDVLAWGEVASAAAILVGMQLY
jgi:hypothetical protein